jgi:hypothetical protein
MYSKETKQREIFKKKKQNKTVVMLPLLWIKIKSEQKQQIICDRTLF